MARDLRIGDMIERLLFEMGEGERGAEDLIRVLDLDDKAEALRVECEELGIDPTSLLPDRGWTMECNGHLYSIKATGQIRWKTHNVAEGFQ